MFARHLGKNYYKIKIFEPHNSLQQKNLIIQILFKKHL